MASITPIELSDAERDALYDALAEVKTKHGSLIPDQDAMSHAAAEAIKTHCPSLYDAVAKVASEQSTPALHLRNIPMADKELSSHRRQLRPNAVTNLPSQLRHILAMGLRGIVDEHAVDYEVKPVVVQEIRSDKPHGGRDMHVDHHEASARRDGGRQRFITVACKEGSDERTLVADLEGALAQLDDDQIAQLQGPNFRLINRPFALIQQRDDGQYRLNLDEINMEAIRNLRGVDDAASQTLADFISALERVAKQPENGVQLQAGEMLLLDQSRALHATTGHTLENVRGITHVAFKAGDERNPGAMIG